MPTKKVSPAKAPKAAVTKASKKSVKKVTKKGNSGLMPLVYTVETKAFWTSEGEILNSLLALREALAKMPKSVFSHHVNTNKNDFATWVEEVLGDVPCARDMRKAKTVAATKKVVTQHLANYQL